MKFIHRLGYYLGGFAIGLIILAYFFSGKKTSCDYGPNARTIKNINLKDRKYSPEALQFIGKTNVDTTHINKVLKYGVVDFGKSKTERDSCKIYVIKGKSELESLEVTVENCSKTATILQIKKVNQ